MAFLGSLRVAVYSPLPTKVKRKLPFHLGWGRRVRLTRPLSHRQPLDDEEMQNTSNFSTANRARGSHQDSIYQSQLFL